MQHPQLDINEGNTGVSQTDRQLSWVKPHFFVFKEPQLCGYIIYICANLDVLSFSKIIKLTNFLEFSDHFHMNCIHACDYSVCWRNTSFILFMCSHSVVSRILKYKKCDRTLHIKSMYLASNCSVLYLYDKTWMYIYECLSLYLYTHFYGCNQHAVIKPGHMKCEGFLFSNGNGCTIYRSCNQAYWFSKNISTYTAKFTVQLAVYGSVYQ